MNLPNKLTTLRVLMIPFFVVFMLTDLGVAYSKHAQHHCRHSKAPYRPAVLPVQHPENQETAEQPVRQILRCHPDGPMENQPPEDLQSPVQEGQGRAAEEGFSKKLQFKKNSTGHRLFEQAAQDRRARLMKIRDL